MGTWPRQEFQHPLVEALCWMSLFSCICMVSWLPTNTPASICSGGTLPAPHKSVVVLAPNRGISEGRGGTAQWPYPRPYAEPQGQSQGWGWTVAQLKYEDGESKTDEGVVNISLQYFSTDGQIPISGCAAQGRSTGFWSSSEGNTHNFLFLNWGNKIWKSWKCSIHNKSRVPFLYFSYYCCTLRCNDLTSLNWWWVD